MDDIAQRTDPPTGDTPVDPGEAVMAEPGERKAGSAVGAIKVGGSQTPGNESREKRTPTVRSEQSTPNVDAYAKRRLEIKKKKRAAHRRLLKASHAKG